MSSAESVLDQTVKLEPVCCTHTAFSSAIGAERSQAAPCSRGAAQEHDVCPQQRMSTSSHSSHAAAEVTALQGRRCDLVDGPTGQGVGMDGSRTNFWLCSGVGRVDSWLLNGSADFGVIARAMLVFLEREVCRDPEEQL